MTAPQSAAAKEKTAQLVTRLPVKQQVDLLAQALLREYMHRRGFKNTLRAFDEQNPRDERTISSRAVMKQLLNIPVEGRPSRLSPQPSAPGSHKTVPPTYMEELCSYRLTKRECALMTRRKDQLEQKAERAASTLTTEEAATLAHWQQDRTAWEDPSDTEISAWREETAQHRLQREAAEALVAQGPSLLEEEQARAEKKQRRKEERRKLKEARRREQKQKNKSRKDPLDDPTALGDTKDGPKMFRGGGADESEEHQDAVLVRPGNRWAPPGAFDRADRSAEKERMHGDSRDDTHDDHVEDDDDDWTLKAMSLNPILSAARREVGALGQGTKLTHGSTPLSAAIGGTAAPSASAPAAHGPFIASTGTAFHAAPIAVASRSEITEAWKPQSTLSSSSGVGYTSAAASRGGTRSGGGDHGAASGGGFTYNPSAVPSTSAMSKPSALATSRSIQPTGIVAPATQGILTHRSSDGGGGGGGGGGSGRLGASIRGDGEHQAHAAGGPIRQGFGFRRDSGTSADAGNGAAGATAAANAHTGRKDRRVKLLVD